MAKVRLTAFSKLLIVFAVLAILFFVITKFTGTDAFESVKDRVGAPNSQTSNNDDWNNNNSSTQEKKTEKPSSSITDIFSSSKKKKAGYKDVINVGVVTWGGYAGGQYFNRGFKPNAESQFRKKYGFDVNFEVIDDFDASRDAFKNGTIDLMWATIDAFPTEVAGLSQYQPQVVFQADWSRGGDAIVARRGIRKVSDLRGKKIAVAPMTPSHSFLIWLLEAGDLTTKNVKIVEVPSAIDAADAFKSGTVDAAVVWSPDDADCVNKVAGASVLESTKNATHIIADVFIAKKNLVEKYKPQLRDLYEGWMTGAAELNGSDTKKRQAAKILADGLGMPEKFCYDAINNVRLTTHGDNKNFFGLNTEFSGVTGEDLYNKMKIKYDDLGYNTRSAKSWRLLSTKDLVMRTNLSGVAHSSEVAKTFSPVTESLKNKESLSSKRVSISFRSGEYRLTENAKQIIDMQFTPIAKAFANARIRVEGNTDNVGDFSFNVSLSKKRAESVASYLMQQHNMPRNRFIIVGNGPNKPVQGCEANQTADCKARNRRTDFELVTD